MQVIFENEDEGGDSRRIGAMGSLIYAEKIRRCMEVECKLVEKFLMSLKKEFSGGEEELVKAVELRKLEQEGRTIEEQKRRGKIEREEGTGKRSPKIGETDNTMTISVAEEANAFLVGNNRACSNRGS